MKRTIGRLGWVKHLVDWTCAECESEWLLILFDTFETKQQVMDYYTQKKWKRHHNTEVYCLTCDIKWMLSISPPVTPKSVQKMIDEQNGQTSG